MSVDNAGPDLATVEKHIAGKGAPAVQRSTLTSTDQSETPAYSLESEKANMRQLRSRQASYVTPLYLSSKQAQAVLKQF